MQKSSGFVWKRQFTIDWLLAERELLTGRLLRRAAHARGSMGKIAGGCRVIEALQVVGGTVDRGDAVASVGAVRHLSVTMVGQDRRVRLCLSFGLDEGRRQEERSQDQHPVEEEGDARM